MVQQEVERVEFLVFQVCLELLGLTELVEYRVLTATSDFMAVTPINMLANTNTITPPTTSLHMEGLASWNLQVSQFIRVIIGVGVPF